MKKRILSILIVILLTVAVLGTATAEGNAAGQSNQTLHIESLKNASYEELEAARQQIIREQRARIKAYILLDQTDLHLLTLDLDDRLFFNCNTPEDYASALRNENEARR